MTAFRYTIEEGGEWHADLSGYTPEEIHQALAEAEVVAEPDGRLIAMEVLDLPDFHMLEVAGERWDARSRRWTPV
jgi:hypothetical protein